MTCLKTTFSWQSRLSERSLGVKKCCRCLCGSYLRASPPWGVSTSRGYQWTSPFLPGASRPQHESTPTKYSNLDCTHWTGAHSFTDPRHQTLNETYWLLRPVCVHHSWNRPGDSSRDSGLQDNQNVESLGFVSLGMGEEHKSITPSA